MKLSGKGRGLAIALLLLAVAVVVPGPRERLVDISRGDEAASVVLERSPLSIVLEPIAGPIRYLASMTAPRRQAWMIVIWALAIAIALRARRVVRIARTTDRTGLRGAVIAMFVPLVRIPIAALLIFVLGVYLPLPPVPARALEEDIILVDLQSHTGMSHDGICTIEENADWHVAHGFDAWAVTDHGHVDGGLAARAIARDLYPDHAVIAGQEENVSGQSYLVLGREEDTSSRELRGDHPSALDLDGVAIVAAHPWWRQRRGYDDLCASGIHAMEMSNMGHLGRSIAARKEILAATDRYAVARLSSSDWHGYSNVCTNWTAARIPAWRSTRPERRGPLVVETLRTDPTAFRPLVIERDEPRTALRYAFEPLAAIGFYFSGLEPIAALPWAVLIVVIWALNSRYGKRFRRGFAAIFWLGGAGFSAVQGMRMSLLARIYAGWNELAAEMAVGLLLLALAAILVRPRGTTAEASSTDRPPEHGLGTRLLAACCVLCPLCAVRRLIGRGPERNPDIESWCPACNARRRLTR